MGSSGIVCHDREPCGSLLNFDHRSWGVGSGLGMGRYAGVWTTVLWHDAAAPGPATRSCDGRGHWEYPSRPDCATRESCLTRSQCAPIEGTQITAGKCARSEQIIDASDEIRIQRKSEQCILCSTAWDSAITNVTARTGRDMDTED